MSVGWNTVKADSGFSVFPISDLLVPNCQQKRPNSLQGSLDFCINSARYAKDMHIFIFHCLWLLNQGRKPSSCALGMKLGGKKKPLKGE